MTDKPTPIDLAKQLLANAENGFHIPWEATSVARAYLASEARCEALEAAGHKLSMLKHYKDTQGKDDYYEREQIIAWQMLRAALAPRSADGKGE